VKSSTWPNTAKEVSKPLPAVEKTAVPAAGACQTHQTDLPPRLETSFPWRVAPTFDPVPRSRKPDSGRAEQASSFSGCAGRCATQLDDTITPASRTAQTPPSHAEPFGRPEARTILENGPSGSGDPGRISSPVTAPKPSRGKGKRAADWSAERPKVARLA
jgi:hypothetical protein